MLILGQNKLDHFLAKLPSSYLLIDDGELIDAIDFPKRRKITVLDFTKHSLNPLKGMDYRKAREFINVLDSIFPEGANTLTKKNANFVLLNALLSKRKRLDALIEPDLKDTGVMDAYQKIQTLLLSPVLNHVLLRPTNFPLDGILVARLDRAALGDFDCFVLGNLFISNYKGHVVVPDFGFYACPFHMSLIRQHRITAGLNFLDEVPKNLRNGLLLMDRPIAARCTYDDAETLALLAGYDRGTVGFSEFVSSCTH